MDLIVGLILLVIGVAAGTGIVDDIGKYGGIHIEAREEKVVKGGAAMLYVVVAAVMILGGTTLVAGWFQPPG